ncbi:hypothetical protein IW261DRAFT_1575736 [Armillaria novae-zelandiae]|uniref:Uncharacterized protein n=1 Tax=Armillaria novae-zelandiae TaxID=153914 RepID=A0AA39ND38_9AGAR|nr:hypothetical protein IW261DRAFT_1575736 [Armillaria novae-zelandiae]
MHSAVETLVPEDEPKRPRYRTKPLLTFLLADNRKPDLRKHKGLNGSGNPVNTYAYSTSGCAACRDIGVYKWRCFMSTMHRIPRSSIFKDMSAKKAVATHWGDMNPTDRRAFLATKAACRSAAPFSTQYGQTTYF